MFMSASSVPQNCKRYPKIQTNVQQIYHGGQGQIISDEVEKGRFWQNTDPWPTYYPADSMYCAYCTFIESTPVFSPDKKNAK